MEKAYQAGMKISDGILQVEMKLLHWPIYKVWFFFVKKYFNLQYEKERIERQRVL